MDGLDFPATALRLQLLDAADADQAIHAANDVIDRVNAILNADGLSVATSLLARALIARGIANVAALWWGDIVPLHAEATLPAIRSLIDDLPPELRSECWIDPALVGERH